MSGDEVHSIGSKHAGQATLEVLLLVLLTVSIMVAPGPDGSANLCSWLVDLGRGWLRFHQWVWQNAFVLPGVA